MQSRRWSMIEALTNILVGVVISFVSQVVIFKAMGIKVSIQENVTMTAYFTVISLVRSYYLRRMFNRLTPKTIDKSLVIEV